MVGRKTKQGYLWILVRIKNSDVEMKRRELPNERCSTGVIVNKSSKRVGGAIDAADAEESKLGLGVVTKRDLRNTNNPFGFETKKFVYNTCEQRTSSLKTICIID